MRQNAGRRGREVENRRRDVEDLQARDLELYGNPDGPTFEQLVAEAKAEGLSGDDVYRHIIDCACQPVPDGYQQVSLTEESPDGSCLLTRRLVWRRTGSAVMAYRTSFEGKELTLRIGDFPEEFLFTLLVNGEAVAVFDLWPDGWRRPPRKRRPLGHAVKLCRRALRHFVR